MLDSQTCREVIELAMHEMEGNDARAFLTTNTRTRIEFGGGQIGPAIRVEEKELTVWVSRGRRVGRASNNDLNGRPIKQVALLAGELAQAAPEDPDLAPALAPQRYAEIPAYDEATDALEPAALVQLVERALARVRAHAREGSGWLELQSQDFAVGNSRGNFGFHRGTSIGISIAAAAADGGEGYASGAAARAADLDLEALAERACAGACALRVVESGRHPVAFAPECVAALLGPFLDWLATLHGGERVLGETLTLASDPAHALVLAPPFADTGAPSERRVWIERGRLVGPLRERPGALVLEGASAEMKEAPPRALLVTRISDVMLADACAGGIAGVASGVLVLERGEIAARAPDFFLELPAAQWLAARGSAPTRVWSPAGGAVAVPVLAIDQQAVVFAQES
jgi:predicted Zn-dependent protease